jgi:hypothetical protein
MRIKVEIFKGFKYEYEGASGNVSGVAEVFEDNILILNGKEKAVYGKTIKDVITFFKFPSGQVYPYFTVFGKNRYFVKELNNEKFINITRVKGYKDGEKLIIVNSKEVEYKEGRSFKQDIPLFDYYILPSGREFSHFKLFTTKK